MKGIVYVVTHKKYTLDPSVKQKGYTLISILEIILQVKMQTTAS